MEAIIIIMCLLVVALIWLNVLATIAVVYDPTLESAQRKGQLVIIWLGPFVGAGFILHLVFQHYPNAIPEKWIPWPFKGLIYGKGLQRNRDRNDDESTAVNGAVDRSRRFESDRSDAGDGD